MSRILIFSDAHIHKHKKSMERLQHCLDALEWVLHTAQKENINDIVFCGDLFHDREKIDVYTYFKTFELFEKYLQGDRKLWLLIGNHDMYHASKHEVTSVKPLGSIKNVTVVDRVCTLQIADHDLSFLPYTHNPIEDLTKLQNKSKFKILFGHCAVDGAIWNTIYNTVAEVAIENDNEMIKVGPEIFDDWDQVFLGHYHAEQRLTDTVEYVGSPLEMNFGEAFQKKHIIIYDLKTHKKTYVENTFSPKHVICDQEELGQHKLGNNFVRVAVNDASDVLELKNELKNNGAATVQFTIKDRKAEDSKIIENAKLVMKDEKQMLLKYAESIDLTGKDKDYLLEVGMEIINYVEETEEK